VLLLHRLYIIDYGSAKRVTGRVGTKWLMKILHTPIHKRFIYHTHTSTHTKITNPRVALGTLRVPFPLRGFIYHRLRLCEACLGPRGLAGGDRVHFHSQLGAFTPSLPFCCISIHRLYIIDYGCAVIDDIGLTRGLVWSFVVLFVSCVCVCDLFFVCKSFIIYHTPLFFNRLYIIDYGSAKRVSGRVGWFIETVFGGGVRLADSTMLKVSPKTTDVQAAALAAALDTAQETGDIP